MCQAPFDALGKTCEQATQSHCSIGTCLFFKKIFFRIQIQTVLFYSECNNPL